jgi:subtilisin-like proprotein convertase family protein
MKTIRLQTVLRACGGLGVLAAGSVFGQTFNTDMTYAIGQTIPDGSVNGLALTENFSAPSIANITSLQVTLDIAGGFNGDYYAYLTHGTGFSVLLNRVGRDAGNSLGYADSGLNVTFDDTSANNIHQYQLTINPAGGALTGTWAPDGRNVDPATVTTASPVTADLSSFTGLDPNGQWTLYLVDADPGGVGTVESFGLDVTGTTVPEQSTTGGLVLLAGTGLCLFRRFTSKSTASA